jgi:transcriptional regulator with XRE-family HTH domain
VFTHLCIEMAELSIKQKKEWAKTLYTLERLLQKEIAKKTGVSEKSISKWAIEGNWEKLRANLTITKEQQLARLYEQLNELTTFIQLKTEGARYANSKEADTIVKLTSAIKSLETESGISETVSVFMNFISHLKKLDLAKAQEIATLQDEYISTLLK